MDYGFAPVGVIVVLAYLIGMTVKASPLNDKWIPIIVGFFGLLLGILCFYAAVPSFPAQDPITAAAVGTVSGLAAVGVNQIGKQLSE